MPRHTLEWALTEWRTESLKSNKNHLRRSKITKNQETGRKYQWTGKIANHILRPFHPKSCLVCPKRVSITFHIQQRSIAQVYARRQGSTTQILSPPRASQAAAAQPFPPNYSTLPANTLRPNHRTAGVKPSSTKSEEEISVLPDTFLAQA